MELVTALRDAQQLRHRFRIQEQRQFIIGLVDCVFHVDVSFLAGIIILECVRTKEQDIKC